MTEPHLPRDPIAEPTDSELAADITRDENGLTADERARWRAHYHAIATLTTIAIGEAPNIDEARRRLALLRLDLRTSAAAIETDLVRNTWSDPAPDPAPDPTA